MGSDPVSPFIPAEEDATSLTLDPEPTQLASPCVECMPKPTVDGQPEPHITSDQVQEPATVHVMVNVAVESEGEEESPASCTTAEGELPLDLKEKDLYVDIPLLPSSF